MPRQLFAVLALLLVGRPAFAQEAPAPGACATPDSVAVAGNARVSETTIRSDAGLIAGEPLNFRAVQRAVRTLFESGQFDDVTINCRTDAAGTRTTLVIHVKERPILQSVDVVGYDALSEGSVKGKSDLIVGRPVDPAQVARVAERIDSLYQHAGYYLARIVPETTEVAGGLKILFRIEEGRRLAVSGIRVNGNSKLSDGEIVGAMQTKPEGFWWFRKGEFDEDKFATDLGEKIPGLYARNGFVDFQILRDTVIIDRERGKALLELEVREGPRYRVGSFDVVGNRRFSTDEIERFYPFGADGPTISERVTNIVRRRRSNDGAFDQARWEEATNRVRTAYSNEGYIYANVRPVVDRQPMGPDSVPTVNLRWEIDEKQPAIINRIEIAGNDYTTETCIRNQLIILPGDVFNQDRLVRSYQNIANLGFFETPMPPPDTRPANEQGDVDIVFNVKEKRTGNVNFGASVGQGTGVGGFIGLDQPNLFGQCKRGSLQWQFGRFQNDFNVTYTDPTIKQSQVSGTINAYHQRLRYQIADLPRTIRTGAQLQFGFPVPNSPFTRLFTSYGLEAVKYGSSEFLEPLTQSCDNCFRSTLGFTATHDTRIDMPFASSGGEQSATAQFNGGPLGGRASFQRYTAEARSYATVGTIGGDRLGSQPIKFVLGLTTKGGAVFGDPGPFFFSQKFALGGVQFGEMLRGYEEFSITPSGYAANANGVSARPESFGSAFFTTTAEFGVRFNQMIYVNTFFDAGNVWNHPREFDPTRLFRGAGFGASLVTPLGPLGLDYAYGFDRLDIFGRPAPKWQLHFRLGQLF
jgi:outer membrane protein insertion porin family